jgi:hypothetical protein
MHGATIKIKSKKKKKFIITENPIKICTLFCISTWLTSLQSLSPDGRISKTKPPPDNDKCKFHPRTGHEGP